MFDKPPKNERRSLLTLAVDNDRREARKRGNGLTKSNQSNAGVLMQALGKQNKKRRPKAPDEPIDIDGIEREINRIADDVRAKSKPGNPAPQMTMGTHGPYSFQPKPIGEDTLLDPVVVGQTMWRWRWVVVASAIGGGILGSFIALSQPKEYTSSAQVLLDPRELRLIERDLTPEFLSNDGALAIVDSQLEIARSTAVLEKVVARTNLDQDPEFNGAGSGGGVGLLDGIRLVRSLFDEETPVDTNQRVTIENLRDALVTDRSSSTFVVNFEATSQSPRKAARLANEHAQAFIDRQSNIEAETASTASTALLARLASLEESVISARKELADFRAANNLFGQTGDEIGTETVSALNAALVNAKASTASARARAQNAQGINVSSVVNGAVPSDLTTPALTTFRAQYASLRQNEAGLRETLGPRHPRLAVAQASVEAARQDIEQELMRIVDAAQTELARAIQSQNEIEAQLAQSNADLGANGQLLGELRRLQGEVAAAEGIYQNALVRAREAGEISALGSVNATILAPAEPALSPSTPSRRVVAILGAIAGLLFGLGVAFLAGCVNSFRHRANSAEPYGDNFYQSSPDGEGAPPTRGRDQTETNEPQQTEASDKPMHHPAYPFYPTAYPQTAHTPQPVAVYPQPFYPTSHAPVAAPYPAMHGAPYAPAAPQPQPQAVVVPQAQPVFVMTTPPSPPTAPMPAMETPQPQQAAQRNVRDENAEIEELRQSVSDIREVLDHLVSTRSRRYG